MASGTATRQGPPQLHMELGAADADRVERIRAYLKDRMDAADATGLLGPTKVTNSMVVRYALGRCLHALEAELSGGD